jgi:type I restriction enzyme S subunit
MTSRTSVPHVFKPTVTPKLRFPEFRREAGWKLRELGTLFSQREEIGYTALRLLSLMDKEGIIPQEDSNRKNNANIDRTKYLRVVPGDIAYNTMRMWEGRSALSKLEGVVSPAYTVCAPNADADGRFFSYYFKTPQLIGSFARYSQGLVKDTLNLKYEAFSRILAATPTPAEQQKIAECLSSLDELVGAAPIRPGAETVSSPDRQPPTPGRAVRRWAR